MDKATKKDFEEPTGVQHERRIAADGASSPKREKKRQAMLRAAVAAFNKRGFHQTSLDEIGETVGVTKAALYYYFQNKSALLAACFDSAMEIANDCLTEARAQHATGRARIVTFFRLYIEKTNEELHDCVLLTEDYALEGEYRNTLIRQRDVVESRLRDLVAEGIADGSIVPCDPKLTVFLLLGAVNWMPKWFSATGRWSYKQVAEATAEMLDRMLSTNPVAALTPDVGQITFD